MAKQGAQQYTDVNASPVKSFFVSMLTRDITIEEAILDLLDNCVDGILRTRTSRATKHPYAGYWAEIKFNKDTFSISDNCGGIPWSLHDYAFRLGRAKDRPRDKPGTVGVYGIGMKRAIFKLGQQCLISTQHGKDNYEVDMTSAWMSEEENWDIPVKAGKRSMSEDGTTIVVGTLYGGISERFSDDARAFKADLERMVSTHYAFIIDKGFSVSINGTIIKPRPTRLIFAPGSRRGGAIQPYIFEATKDGVSVFLAVGFTQPIPSQDEAAQEQEEKQYSSLDAGWTVVCNDRAVLYCDRTELTGWGEAGIPRYHNQFIAISGIVEFRADDPSKLPTTTTKRGIDASSSLYLQIKNKMRDGMRIFTDYTNKWKGRADEARRHIEGGSPLSFDEIKLKAATLPLTTTTKAVPAGKQYKPSLPMPKQLDGSMRRISFLKKAADVQQLGDYLFDDAKSAPSDVGSRCFDIVLRESKK